MQVIAGSGLHTLHLQELDSDWTNGNRSAAQQHTGSFSMTGANGTTMYQAITWVTAYQSNNFEFTGWLWTDTGTIARLIIDDGVICHTICLQPDLAQGSINKFFR